MARATAEGSVEDQASCRFEVGVVEARHRYRRNGATRPAGRVRCAGRGTHEEDRME